MGKLITMSQQEVSRLEIIQKLLERRLSQAQAADILHITTRQVQRLLRAYRQQGVIGVISKLCAIMDRRCPAGKEEGEYELHFNGKSVSINIDC